MTAEQGRKIDEDIALTATARALQEQFGVSATRWQIYKLIVDGRIPASRRGREWIIARADLPRVAEALAPRAA